ncbi:aspartate ammonia-lyase [Sporomusaceae bacterium BoRhaA]|uniref:aspartate ammonia-lyase n=1 Tax=Pelorhabdus rhamnosifermentans TaxID=2772457 RepID=UPI001C063805|nr:aspartate ammonia-lyase [Pelorhabdus rhamnosifermentans]MBU2703138.1 aspartate ammonia-lyase [Pelorhabdus rhamnosifermentans]
MRQEQDVLGKKSIADDCYYGIHTARAHENFDLSRVPVHPDLIKALAMIKYCCAQANSELNLLDSKKAQAICQAAQEVIQGQWRDQFSLDALQGGAGTSTNMNMNEVLANRALEILGYDRGCYDVIHPINDVNKHQSTNDVYPTALKVAAIWLLKDLSEACAFLQEALQKKEAEFAQIIKIGRTELQDAVPIMLGQEFGAYAQAIARDRWRIYKVEERLRQVNLGGTAIGTGLNAERKYIYLVNEKLALAAKIGLARAEDMIDATQNADVFVEVSGLIKTLAVNLGKIAHDLRLMSSGPRCGLGEINLPELQAGSSIMPGKVNPVLPEAVNQVAFQVISSDVAISLAAQSGQLELNAFLPLIAHHLLGNISLLKRTVTLFTEKCIQGITANAQACHDQLQQSLAVATALVPAIGYDAASAIAHQAFAEHKSVLQIAQQSGYLSPSELAEILQPERMTRPMSHANRKRK